MINFQDYPLPNDGRCRKPLQGRSKYGNSTFGSVGINIDMRRGHGDMLCCAVQCIQGAVGAVSLRLAAGLRSDANLHTAHVVDERYFVASLEESRS